MISLNLFNAFQKEEYVLIKQPFSGLDTFHLYEKNISFINRFYTPIHERANGVFFKCKNEKKVMKYTQLLFINDHSLYNSFTSAKKVFLQQRRFSMAIVFTQLLIKYFGFINKNIQQ